MRTSTAKRIKLLEDRAFHSIRNSPSPADLSLLDQVASHLDPNHLPPSTRSSSPNSSEEEAAELALASIQFIGSILRHARQNSEIYMKTVRLWSGLWKWAEHLLRTRADIDPDSTEELTHRALETIKSIGRLILFASSDRSPLAALMAAQPNFWFTVTSCWVQEGMHDELRRLQFFATAFGRLLAVSAETLRSWPLSEVIDAANGHKDLARLVIRRLRWSLMENPFVLRRALDNLVVLINLASIHDDALYRALLHHQSIVVTIDLLVLISNYRSDRLFNDAVQLCHQALYRLCYTSGSHWAIQALENDFLPALLNCSRHVENNDPREHRHHFSGFLRAVFEPYLVYRPVVRAAARALVEYTKWGINLPAHQHEDWRVFANLIIGRKELKDQFDSENTYRCWSCEIHVSDCAKALKQCSGCLGPRYCSKQCQRKDWPSHRAPCIAHQLEYRDADDYSLRTTFLELMFFKLIAEVDMTRALDSLNGRIAEYFPDVPITDLVFTFDLVDTLAEIAIDTIDCVEDPAIQSLRAAGLPDDTLLIRIQVRTGGSNRKEAQVVLADTVKAPNGLRRPT